MYNFSVKNSEMDKKSVFITGSTKGIGKGIAEAFAKVGARLYIHGKHSTPSLDLQIKNLYELGAKKVMFVPFDLRDAEKTRKSLIDISSVEGIDILVNNAGVQRVGSMATLTTDFWNEVIAVNLNAIFHTMQVVLPRMADKGYGRVINISSAHGLVASVNKAPYVAAKHGLIGLTKVAALEYAKFGTSDSGGVTVNAVCPGWVETGLIESQILEKTKEFKGSRDKGIKELVREKQPSERLSSPSDIGELVLWLSSKSAHNVTGASISIDGGWTAQ
jgi:3-hydroxybutyrate dehydrogenase